jgi:hypothetical protein
MRTSKTRTIAGSVSAAGQPTGGSEPFAVNKTAVGNYQLIFPPGLRLLALNATPAGWGALSVSAFTGSGCTVVTGAQSGASTADLAFIFQAAVAA